MTSAKGPKVNITPETTPFYPSSVYTFPSLTTVEAYFADGGTDSYLYRRNGNPNEDILAKKLAALEHAPAATLAATGMGIIAQTLMALLRPGDHILASRFVYGGTHALFQQILIPYGIEVSYIDLSNHSWRNEVRSNTKLLYSETIANPLLQVADAKEVGQAVKDLDLMWVVDNTFATPYLHRPIEYGATVSLHSLTKYLNGHSDAMGGVACGDEDIIARIQSFSITFGGTISPYDAWMTERGLETFHLRMPAQVNNAGKLAELLQAIPQVEQVYYPGLQQHPSHASAVQTLTGGFGAIVSFDIEGGYEAANRFVSTLKHIVFAPSLGGVKTTISHPGLTSHRAYTADERAGLGVGDGLIRLSVGAEPIDLLVADLQQALSHC